MACWLGSPKHYHLCLRVFRCSLANIKRVAQPRHIDGSLANLRAGPMSRNAPNDGSRLQAILQTFKLGSLARHDLVVPLLIRLPPWALITYGVFTMACRILRETFPQESADRLAWWGYVLELIGRVKLPIWSRKRSKRLVSAADSAATCQRYASQDQGGACEHA